MEYGELHYALEVKSVTDAGQFEGYGAVIGNVDRVADVIEPGAFDKWQKKRGDEPIPVLWQHRYDEPIGVYDEVTPDKRGLKVRGRLAIPDVRRAVEAHALMKMRAVNGLSIGYYTEKAEVDRAGVRHLHEIGVDEVSIVTFPANPKARVTAVKAFNNARDLEAFLVDAGMSRRDAKRIVAEGFKGLSLRDADEPGKAAGLSPRDADGAGLLAAIEAAARTINP